MSSSVFSESPVSTNESRMNDSNLVVVYGKNGVNGVDRQGLENLMDDKAISTISVVRLTSPTPSMKEEEETENELKKAKKKENENDDEDDEENSSDQSSHSEKSSNSESDDEKEDSNDKDLTKKCKTNTKKLQKEKPESVGLIIEDFCLPEKTKEITKAALTLSGLQPLSVSVDFEVQVKALQNDHCYTPLTSPSQLHDRKPEPKQLPPSAISAATLAKAAQKMAAIKAKNAALRAAAAASERSIEEANNNVNKKVVEESEDNETAEDENESDYTESEESADTDNDRDSDLDFDVNDRSGRRRKSSKKMQKRKLKKNKILKKRQSISDFNSSQEEDKKTSFVAKVIRGGVEKSPAQQNVSHHTSFAHNSNAHKTMPLKFNPVQSAAKMLITNPKGETRHNRFPSSSNFQKQSQQKNSQSDVLSNIITGTGKPSGDPSGKPVVQNVVIIKPPNNKPVNNNSGGFTDITKYLTKSENLKTSNVQVCELVKLDNTGVITARRNQQDEGNSHSINKPSISSPNRIPRKGFMPLVPDKSKSQLLPAQISVQIQQKNESAIDNTQKDFENQDEMDIIDSLVGQIQKSEQNKMNATTPKIIKMFETNNSTNQNLFVNQHVSQKKPMLLHTNTSHSTFTTATNQVDPVDISNAPLLETSDEIPEDLIKDMAELIDHKTLQELVEEQQQQLQNQQMNQSMNVTDFENSIPKNYLIHPVSHSENPKESQPNRIVTDNILQLNHLQNTSLNQSDFESNDILTEKSNDSIMKETQATPTQQPVQVVSRSGRVIILPPIEAPTTRAKRRAAVGVGATDTPTPPMSSNVSEASESEYPSTPKLNIQSNKQQTKSNSRRNSKDQQKKPVIDQVKKRNSLTVNSDENQSQDESSQEDEDDPNKLWCICRQPHNNRFMICCDVCEDWFHGTCVGVTKSMGKEMEMKKIEWTCPNCKDGKKQQNIKDMFEKQTVEDRMVNKISLQDKKQNTTKKTYKRKSMDIPLIPSVSAPLSKSMQQKISEIIGVPIPEPIAKSFVQNEDEQTETLIAPKKKAITNRVLKTPVAAKSKPEKVSSNKKKENNRNKEIEPDTSKLNQQSETTSDQISPAVEGILCIVCKRDHTRPNSIYCSDDCIRKHAHNALVSKTGKPQVVPAGSTSPTIASEGTEKKKKQPSSFEEALGGASILTPKKIERVCVFERKTGKILTGNNAPTTTNLKRWLQENPTFEVVQPGSPQALAIERNKLKQKSQTAGLSPEAQQRTVQVYRQQTARPPSQQKNVIKIIKSISSNPSPKPDSQPLEINEVSHKSVAQKAIPFNQMSPMKAEKSDMKIESRSDSLESKSDKTEKIKLEKVDTKEKSDKANKGGDKSPVKVSLKKQVSRDRDRDRDSDRSSEPIRLNVKRTLKEKLLTRLGEITEEHHPKLSESECEMFANETEEEMFELFKDTGVKYKAKYRSLIFNIKDHKNKTLFRKICEKVIEPKQLVRMTPEELASQELAQWRENENKHQLEMIKKSELDLLSCAKNYVLKTHKGEEVIEDKHTDRVNLDISIPVEDVVAVLNNSTVSSTSEMEKTTPTMDSFKSMSQDYYDIDNSFGANISKSDNVNLEFNQSTSELDEEKRKENRKDREKERDRDKHYKSKDRHREKSSKRSRSRSRSRDRKRHRSPQKDKENRSHHAHRSSPSLERELSESKSKKSELENLNQHDQDEDLHGFHERDVKSKQNSNKNIEDKEKSGNNDPERRSESADTEYSESKSERRDAKSHHHSHHHRDEEKSSNIHDRKRRSYTHSPSQEDEDERKKRRHHSSHHSQSHHHHHHRSSSQISESSQTMESDENKKDGLSKSKNFLLSSTEGSGSKKSSSKMGTNKHNASQKLHKTKQSVHKVKSTDLSAYSLIDKIFAESEKTIEEAANLVPVAGKEKSAIKPADSQSSAKSSIENINISTETKDLKNTESSGNDSEQELPSSTVTIPTPPQDPYEAYASDISAIIWTGNINMIDVATFNIVIQPISGNCTNMEKDFPVELDVVGRIGPETVWDYIGKIKKSPNKEIILVRLVPSPQSETIAYTALYSYLEKRKRLGVVKSTSPGIKDFYVLPLHSKTKLPAILQAPSNSEFFDDDSRPDLLIGILIRIMDSGFMKRYPATNPSSISESLSKSVKKPITATLSSATNLRADTTVIQNKKLLSLGDPDLGGEEEDYKPESPHINMSGTKVFSILGGKTVDKIRELKSLKLGQLDPNKEMYIGDDADEPYSPGGSSDDDITAIKATAKVDIVTPVSISNTATLPESAEEIQRKVDELTRQIEKEKKEIETLGTVALPATTAEFAPSLANISIPSNLQQILASIQKPDLPSNITLGDKDFPNRPASVINLDEEEYNPEDAFYDIKSTGIDSNISKIAAETMQKTTTSSSRLANLSEAELLKMVPDNIDLSDSNSNSRISLDRNLSPPPPPPPPKKSRWDIDPSPPGLEDEYDE